MRTSGGIAAAPVAAQAASRGQAIDVAVDVSISNDGNLQALVTNISKREAQAAAQASAKGTIGLMRGSKKVARF